MVNFAVSSFLASRAVASVRIPDGDSVLNVTTGNTPSRWQCQIFFSTLTPLDVQIDGNSLASVGQGLYNLTLRADGTITPSLILMNDLDELVNPPANCDACETFADVISVIVSNLAAAAIIGGILGAIAITVLIIDALAALTVVLLIPALILTGLVEAAVENTSDAISRNAVESGKILADELRPAVLRACRNAGGPT